jgi:L,D-peptidoglycan transpeptidase YkuD (ErfK/YbiS/YcfS/YnhG family)
MPDKAREKKSKLDVIARITQIATGLSIITGIIIGIIGLYNAHRQAIMGFRTMRLASLQYINQLIDQDTNVRIKIGKFLNDNEGGLIESPKRLFAKYETGERMYLSYELSDFRDIFRYYEQLGAKVKLEYIDVDLIYEVIPFPDKYWDYTKALRAIIKYNWYGEGKPLKDFGENFLYLRKFYEDQRGLTHSPFDQVLPKYSKIMEGSSQILLVVNDKIIPYDAEVYIFEKRDRKWQMAYRPMDALIGENGFAAPGEKREGDGKTPAGIFPLTRTFGYPPTIGSRMPYTQVTDDDIWVNDSNSVNYNKWVKKSQTKETSFEAMKRDDDLYKYGIVIEYNTNPVQKRGGSAIFMHVMGGPCITTGCVSLAEDDLVKILGWLDPSRKPMVLLGTGEMLRSMFGKSEEMKKGTN